MPHAEVKQIALTDRRAYSLSEVAGLTGFAISTLYKLIHAGRLRSVKIAGRRVITSNALDEFLSDREPSPGATGTEGARHANY
jgi:excisionase family DNA binding protein